MACQIRLESISCSGRLVSPVSFGSADAVLGAGPAAVAQFQVGELATRAAGAGVGGERGVAVPVAVGGAQLRAGVWSFPADDDPHPRWPAAQVHQPARLDHPRPRPRLVVGVVGGLPCQSVDVSTLYFETDTGDGFREPGFSKERRLEPQITIGLLTDAAGFPLMVEAFEGNSAETTTMLSTIRAFMAAYQLADVTVVTDAGMISARQQAGHRGRAAVVHPRHEDPRHPVRGDAMASRAPRRADPSGTGALVGLIGAHGRRTGIPPEKISFPHAPAAATVTAGFPLTRLTCPGHLPAQDLRPARLRPEPVRPGPAHEPPRRPM